MKNKEQLAKEYAERTWNRVDRDTAQVAFIAGFKKAIQIMTDKMMDQLLLGELTVDTAMDLVMEVDELGEED